MRKGERTLAGVSAAALAPSAPRGSSIRGFPFGEHDRPGKKKEAFSRGWIWDDGGTRGSENTRWEPLPAPGRERQGGRTEDPDANAMLRTFQDCSYSSSLLV